MMHFKANFWVIFVRKHRTFDKTASGSLNMETDRLQFKKQTNILFVFSFILSLSKDALLAVLNGYITKSDQATD